MRFHDNELRVQAKCIEMALLLSRILELHTEPRAPRRNSAATLQMQVIHFTCTIPRLYCRDLSMHPVWVGAYVADARLQGLSSCCNLLQGKTNLPHNRVTFFFQHFLWETLPHVSVIRRE